MQLVQFWAPTVEPTPDHYFDNSTGFQYTNASSTRQRCWRVERTRLVSRPTWRNTSFNASHLVRPAQLHYRYCLSRDWPLISQDVNCPMPHLSFGTVCLQKSCRAIQNIVLKDILRHPCLIAVTRLSVRYFTGASAAFCRHTWHFINVVIIIIIKPPGVITCNITLSLLHDKQTHFPFARWFPPQFVTDLCILSG